MTVETTDLERAQVLDAQIQFPAGADLLFETLGDGSLAVLDRANQAVYRLNSTAAAIWNACKRAVTLADVVCSLPEPLSSNTSEQTVLDGALQLAAIGLLKLTNMPASAAAQILPTQVKAAAPPIVLAFALAPRAATAPSSAESASSLSAEDLLTILEEARSSPEFFKGASAILDTHLEVRSPRPRKATPRSARRLLTIGMATHNDYDGVFFSVEALRLYHPEVCDKTEVLVIDNDPDGPCAALLKSLDAQLEGYRYYPYDSFRGTSVRDMLFREANSDFVLSMDSHVLFPPGTLARFVSFLEDQTRSNDLWQGPVLTDGLRPTATHFKSVWSEGMHGRWAWDTRAADIHASPFEIPMQGLGVFACRKAAWPGFNPRFHGFGCEEGYIHEKIRRRGGAVLCLPFLRWLHRFDRPAGVPYRLTWGDRIRNYLIGYDELGLDCRPVIDHFTSFLGQKVAGPLIEAAQREISSPFYIFDAVFSVGADVERCQKATGTRVRRVVTPETPWDPQIGRVLAHRKVVEEAALQELRSVLVAEGDPLRGWAYDSAVFDRFLRGVPDTPTTVALWLRGLGRLESFGRPVDIE